MATDTGTDPFDHMPDAELGALTRRTMALLADTAGREGVKRMTGACGALFLIGAAARAGGAKLSIHLEGVTVEGKNSGDWSVIVLRPNSDADLDAKDGASVLLGGDLHPGKAGEAIACFSKLTVLRVEASSSAG